MRRNRRTTGPLGIAVAFALLLAACGGGEDAPAPAPAPEPPSTDAEEEADDGEDASDVLDVDPLTITFASAFAPSGLNAGMEYWAEQLEARTGGAVTVDFHYSGSLIDGFEIFGGISSAAVDAGTIPPAYNPAELPLANVLSIPFQTSDAVAQMNAFYELTRESEALRDEYAANNVHVLMMQPAADGAVGLAAPIDGPADLSGLRLRAIGYVAAALQQLGIEPVAIGPGELYESIQRGVIDGYGGFVFDTVHTLGLHEVAPNTYDIGLGQYSVQIIGVNLEWWNSLDPALQDLMTEVAEDFMFNLAADRLAEFEAEACDAILDSGGSVTIFSDEQIAEVQATIGDSAVDAWIENVGSVGVAAEDATAFREDFLARLANYEGQDLGYVSGMRTCAGR